MKFAAELKRASGVVLTTPRRNFMPKCSTSWRLGDVIFSKILGLQSEVEQGV